MRQNTKSIRYILLAGLAAVLILIIVGIVAWVVSLDFNAASEVASHPQGPARRVTAANGLPLAVVSNSNQPTPLPSPVNLGELQTPMPAPHAPFSNTKSPDMPALAVVPQDVAVPTSATPKTIAGGTAVALPQTVVPNGPASANPPDPALAILSRPSGGHGPTIGTGAITSSNSGVPALPQTVSVAGAGDTSSVTFRVGDSLQRQMAQLADDDDVLDEGQKAQKARRFVMSLCRDQQGRVWVGCEDSGVWCYDEHAESVKQWTQFTRANTGGPAEPSGATIEAGPWLGDDNGYALTCDKLGRIWVGHLNHGVSVYNGKQWRNYGVLEGPLGERVFAIATCPTDGDVWIATNAGLTRYSLSKDTWTYYTRTEGLPSDQASAIAFDKDGNIIVGTPCDGLILANAKDSYKIWRQVTCVKEYERHPPLAPKGSGLPTNVINAILVTNDGTFCVGTPTGLAWSADKGQSWQFIRGADWSKKVQGIKNSLIATAETPPPYCLLMDDVTSLSEDDSGAIWVGFRSFKCTTHTLPAFDRRAEIGTDAGQRNTFAAALLPQANGTMLGAWYGRGVSSRMTDTLSSTATPRTKSTQTVGLPALPKAMTAPTLEDLDRAFRDLAGSGPTDLPEEPWAVAIEDDWLTRGACFGRYGKYWCCLCGGMSSTDYIWSPGPDPVNYVKTVGPNTLNVKGEKVRNWIPGGFTDDKRSLELHGLYCDYAIRKSLTTPDKTHRVSEWDDHGEVYPAWLDGPDLYCSIQVPRGLFCMSLYEMNKDGHTASNSNRHFTVSLRSHTPTSLRDMTTFDSEMELAHSAVENFWGGVYKRFLIKGPTSLTICIRRNGSWDTTLAGVMLDAVDEQPSPYFATRGEWHKMLNEADMRLSSVGTALIPATTSQQIAPLVFAALNDLKLRNPRRWASVHYKDYQMLARYYRANQNNQESESATCLSSCYFYLHAYEPWERHQRRLGLLPARDIETRLKWTDDVPWDNEWGYPAGYAYDTIRHATATK